MEDELTYEEHIKARNKKLLEEYDCEITALLRNTIINIGDIKDTVLTEQFFNRKDIPKNIMKILKRLTDKVYRDIV